MDDHFGFLITADQFAYIARQFLQANSMQSRSRDRFVRDAQASDEFSFHAAFASYPKDFIYLFGERLKNGESGVHSATRHSCAN